MSHFGGFFYKRILAFPITLIGHFLLAAYLLTYVGTFCLIEMPKAFYLFGHFLLNLT